jgi:predicted dehydrogenase
MDKRVRVAGVGTGGIFGTHLRAFPDIPQLHLTAFVDPNEENLGKTQYKMWQLYEEKAAASEAGHDTGDADRLRQDVAEVETYGSIEELLAKDPPDVVDICTHADLHGPLSVKALEAGVHVMCEKPMARTYYDCRRIVEAADRTGKLYQHGENWLWEPKYYTAKKLIDAGWIGEPVAIYLSAAHGGPEGSPSFWDSGKGGGGSALDMGVHAIGAAWFLAGVKKQPTAIKAANPVGVCLRMPERIVNGRFDRVSVDDDAHLLVRFEDPTTGAWTTAHIEGSWTERDAPSSVIHGTAGSIEFREDETGDSVLAVRDAQGAVQVVPASGPTWCHWPSSFYGEVLNFVECVRAGVRSISDERFGMGCQLIVGAAYLSEARGRNAVTPRAFERFVDGIQKKHPDDADDRLVEALLEAVVR